MLNHTGRATIRLPRYSVSRLGLVMGACGLVLILGTAGVVAWREREIAFREARQGAQDSAFSLADHAARLFEVADLALRTTTRALGDRSWDDAEGAKPLWSEMRSTAEALPYIADLWLTDAAGRLRLSSAAFPAPPVDLSFRAAVAAVSEGADGLVVGDALPGAVTDRPTFLVAHRLTGIGGAFRGMVAASADLAYFVGYWRRLDLPHDAHVAIVKLASGSVLVRTPDLPPLAPTSVPALRAAAESGAPAGRYAPAPGRMGFYHRIGDLPLCLTVSFSEATIEQEWRAWLATFLVFPGTAILALAAIMALTRRQSRVEARASGELKRARAQLALANQGLEQRVAERTADLKESNAEVQRFAYIVSHDLRAPLVNIMGFTSELQRLRPALFPAPAPESDAVRDDFDEAIGFVQSSIDKMDRLIKAILLLARQGSRVFEPEPVDMEALMRSIADGVAHRAQSVGARIAVHPLPPLVIDRIAAEQVFSNLIDNAVKYLRPGVPGEIAVDGTLEGNRVAIRVSDNGRGIAGRDHGRVFELFRRSGAQNQPGDGIGLAHVRTLVRQLGGTIALESTLGEGSAFTVVLPRTPDGAPP